MDPAREFSRVVWLVGALVDQAVGGDMGHNSLESRHAALIVWQEMHIRSQSAMNHIDVFGSHPRGHNEAILQGHQIQRGAPAPITPPGV